MNRFCKWLFVFGLSPIALTVGSNAPALADGLGTPEVITDVSSGDGVTIIKMYAPKYRERLNNLKEQIDLGVSKGWLTPEQADQFRKEHERISALEAEVRGKGYQKADVANLEKEVTAFNGSLSTALTKGSAPAVPKDQTTNYAQPEDGKPADTAGTTGTAPGSSGETAPAAPAPTTPAPATPAPTPEAATPAPAPEAAPKPPSPATPPAAKPKAAEPAAAKPTKKVPAANAAKKSNATSPKAKPGAAPAKGKAKK